MIGSLSHNSRWVEVNGSSAVYPYVATGSNNPMQGLVRCLNNRMEVFDGVTWMPLIGSNYNIDLTTMGKMAIEWAYNKMQEERFLKDLAKTNAAIADAHAAVERAEEQLRVVVSLTQENK